MKVLKKAEQKNAPLSTDMYTEDELKNLEYQGYIFRIDDNDVWRVSLTMCETIGVKYISESIANQINFWSTYCRWRHNPKTYYVAHERVNVELSEYAAYNPYC